MFGQAIVQTCVIHLIRNTFRYASKRYWGQISTDLKPIYVAPTREAGWRAFEEFDDKWGKPYPAISGLWRTAWEQFIPFLDYTTPKSARSSARRTRSLSPALRQVYLMSSTGPFSAVFSVVDVVISGLSMTETGRRFDVRAEGGPAGVEG